MIFPAIMAACFFAAFHPALYKLSIRWSSGDNSYCWLIIPLFIYLCWDMRAGAKEDGGGFRFGEFSWSSWGLAPLILSIGLMILGELGSVETILYIGVWGCMVAAAVMLYGARVRRLIFPLLILFFIVPLPPFINRMLTFKLKMAASSLSVSFMRLMGASVFQEGNVIDLGVSQLQVVDACSGLRYFMPMVLMALLIGCFFCKGWARRTILLALAPPVSVFVNGLRIFITGMLTVKGHPELAQDFFHDFSGLVIFLAAAAMLVFAAFVLRKIGPSPSIRVMVDPGGRLHGPRGPAVLTITACLLFIAAGLASTNLASARNLPGRTPFESFPDRIDPWRGEKHKLPEEILDALWADDYINAVYYKQGRRNRIRLLIPFYEYQGTRHTAHAPQSCMLGGGWSLLDASRRGMKMNAKERIEVMTMVWKKGETRYVSIYFFLQRGRIVISPWMNKLYLMWDAITRGRTDGALVRAEMMLTPGQSVEDARAMLEEFMAAIWTELPRYVPGVGDR
ncbi:MAG: VPLPA-CTERM-specific exosortase XrtD, partial [Desulfobacterales bacterium]|nr:VPLPA-CTERM-specific exosortase XrtD [Desulfobacterales bacterium]